MADEIGYAVNVNRKVGMDDRDTINVQFNMAVNSSAAEWNKALDLITQVLDRQLARAELPGYKQALAVKERVAETIRADIKKMEGTVEFKTKNSELRDRSAATEIANINSQRENLAKVEREISDFKKILTDLEKKAA